MKKNKNQSAFIAFTSLLVIAAVTLAIAVSVSLIAVSGLKNSLSYKNGKRISQFAEACLEESLLRLRDDIYFTGTSLNINNLSCTIVVSGIGANRTIYIESSTTIPPIYTKKLTASIKRLGNSINLLSVSN